MQTDVFTTARMRQARRGSAEAGVATRSCLLLALALAGCAAPPPTASPEPAPQEAPGAIEPATPAPSPPSASGRTGRSSAASLAAYKLEVAEHVHAAAADAIFEGAPPPTLRSIVVLSLVIDREGNLAEARVVRDNGDAEMVRLALDSARRAAPFPAPPSRVSGRGRVNFYETWLFRDDGRFRLRSLAQAQQSGD
jgi:protein TonB